MTVVGGNLERKEIGLPIGVSGTHDNTEINRTTGFLQLMQVDVDGQGRPIYTEQGSWTSDVIDLGDKFKDFEKVFTTNTTSIGSSFAIFTRVSDDGKDWSDWVAIAMDGAIQSDVKQFIQVRIDLFAGFVTDNFVIAKSDFNTNEYIEEKKYQDAKYIIPTLTSNTSSQLGTAFSSSNGGTAYQAFKAFDKSDSTYFRTADNQRAGFVGFLFKNEKYSLTGYSVSSGSITNTGVMVKDWKLEGSNNTTNGVDGIWDILDSRSNQTWTASKQVKNYTIEKTKKYKAFRLNFSNNNTASFNYTCLGHIDFLGSDLTLLQLKHDYEFDMKLDSTWSDTGSLHRKKITRDDWVKIDRLNVAMR